MSRCVRLSLAAAMLTASACLFDAAVPADALLTCRTDDDCPASARCNRAGLCSTAIDDTPPTLASVTMDPAFARAGTAVALVITADEPLAADVAPALTFAAANPGFVVSDRPSLTTVSYLLPVDDVTPGEGEATLVSVHFVDAAGNEADVAVADVVLTVDRTAPTIAELVLEGGLPGGSGEGDTPLLSDQPGTNELSVTMGASEPLDVAGTDVLLGAERLSCAAGDDPAVVECGVTVTAASAGIPDGTNLLSVRVADRAGNAADAVAPVVVDTRAPRVVAGSVALTVNGALSATAATSDVVSLVLLVDEPLGEPPIVTVAAPTPHVFTVAEQTGSFYRLSLLVGAVPVDGVYDVRATLTDRFGHTITDALVPLPPPGDAGLQLVSFPLSPCPDTGVCPDVDGDGFFGGAPACAAGLATDCDDANPLVFPGATEVPGDGVGNDCEGPPLASGATFDAAGDALIDEAIGVFASPAGNDANPGTRAAPKRTITAAEAVAGTSKIVFLAVGSYTAPSGAEHATSVVGGLDPVTWAPTATRSVIVPSSDVREFYQDGGPEGMRGLLAHVGVGIVGTDTSERRYEWVDVDFDDFDARALTMFVGARGFDMVVTRDGSRLIDSEVNAVFVDARNVLVHRSVAGAGVHVSAGADATIVDSVVDTDGDVAVECDDCTAVRVAHSVIVGDGDVVRVLGDAQSEVVLLNNIVAPDSGSTYVRAATAFPLTTTHNLVAFVGGALYARTSTALTIANDAAGRDAFRACAFTGCALSDDVFGSIALASADPAHLDGDPTASVAYRAGEPLAATPGLAPASAVADVDGTCRPALDGAAPNIGADE